MIILEQHIQQAMNDEIIKQASTHYGIRFEDIKHVGGFENFIYEYSKDENDYILRFVHSTHRSYEHVFAELEFVDYLAKSGANVSTMVHTIEDELLVKIPTIEKEYFSVCVFTKASGTHLKQEYITDEFMYHFGVAVGRLHSLTKDFKPNHKRYHWYEEDYVEIGKRNLPEEYRFVIDKAIAQKEKINQYKTDIDSYGLIHTDLHFGNMFFDGKELTFFDFDDASYKHFISDIAIIIFYYFGYGTKTDEEIEEEAITLMTPFIKGYETMNQLDRYWFEQLNEFIKLREIILFMVIYAGGEELRNRPYAQRYFEKYAQRIKHDVPFFNLERVLQGIWNS